MDSLIELEKKKIFILNGVWHTHSAPWGTQGWAIGPPSPGPRPVGPNVTWWQASCTLRLGWCRPSPRLTEQLELGTRLAQVSVWGASQGSYGSGNRSFFFFFLKALDQYAKNTKSQQKSEQRMWKGKKARWLINNSYKVTHLQQAQGTGSLQGGRRGGFQEIEL